MVIIVGLAEGHLHIMYAIVVKTRLQYMFDWQRFIYQPFYLQFLSSLHNNKHVYILYVYEYIYFGVN